jgi:hypothetical protein
LTFPASPELDTWLAAPTVTVTHHRSSRAKPDDLWEAARTVQLGETRMLGRLVRWRIPGVPAGARFETLFRCPPFIVLEEGEWMLVSGLVGRIWTLRRDYPVLKNQDEFLDWSKSGTAKVVFAHWVEARDGAGSELRSEARVKAYGVQGRLGLASVRPLISRFQQLVANDALAAAVRASERK